MPIHINVFLFQQLTCVFVFHQNRSTTRIKTWFSFCRFLTNWTCNSVLQVKTSFLYKYFILRASFRLHYCRFLFLIIFKSRTKNVLKGGKRQEWHTNPTIGFKNSWLFRNGCKFWEKREFPLELLRIILFHIWIACK